MVTTETEKTPQSTKENALILWFEEVGMGDVALVGGKNASLGEMLQQLKSKGVNVPDGFAVTAYAYRRFNELPRFRFALEARFLTLLRP